MNHHEVEPIPGLPQALPPGEQILWQGRPSWQGLARNTFQVGWVALYFAGLALVRVALVQGDQGLGRALWAGAGLLVLGVCCVALLTLLSWAHSRATVYTITSKRVVLRIGVALSISFNLPFKRLAAADLRLHHNERGEGDICLELLGKDRIGWLHLWPHTRPWRFARAQPTLRSVPDATQVARVLGEAVRAQGSATASSIDPETNADQKPAGGADAEPVADSREPRPRLATLATTEAGA